MPQPLFWICLAFVTVLGAVVGSFLNVVIYRLPAGVSIVRPPSRCPSCGRRLSWFDNVPVLAWCYLRGRCRTCGAPISVQYPLVEAATALLFALTYWVFLVDGWRPNLAEAGIGLGADGGTGLAVTVAAAIVVALHLALVGSLVAASMIDAKLYIIPLEIPWFAAAVAAVGWPLAAVGLPAGVYVDGPLRVGSVPLAVSVAAALLGLAAANVLVRRGLLPRSFDGPLNDAVEDDADQWSHPHPRREVLKELAFLAFPLGAAMVGLLAARVAGMETWLLPRWLEVAAGVGLGYLVGGGLIWGIRIAGTLAFGREAMGLGDVHLMGAVGAALGAADAALVVFLTPFPALLLIGLVRGVGWVLRHRRREIPYGPYLSLTAVLVMLAREPVWRLISGIFSGDRDAASWR